MKRTFWTGLGYTVGLGTSVYVQRRLRRTAKRYAPQKARQQVAHHGRAVAQRAKKVVVDLRDAAQDGVAAMRDERRDLMAEFIVDEAPLTTHQPHDFAEGVDR